MMSTNKMMQLAAFAGIPLSFVLTGCSKDEKADDVSATEGENATGAVGSNADDPAGGPKITTASNSDNNMLFAKAQKDKGFLEDDKVTCGLGNHYRQSGWRKQVVQKDPTECRSTIQLALADKKYMNAEGTQAVWVPLYKQYEARTGGNKADITENHMLVKAELNNNQFGPFIVKCFNDFKGHQANLTSLRGKYSHQDEDLTEFNAKMALLVKQWLGTDPVAVSYTKKDGKKITCPPRKNSEDVAELFQKENNARQKRALQREARAIVQKKQDAAKKVQEAKHAKDKEAADLKKKQQDEAKALDETKKQDLAKQLADQKEQEEDQAKALADKKKQEEDEAKLLADKQKQEDEDRKLVEKHAEEEAQALAQEKTEEEDAAKKAAEDEANKNEEEAPKEEEAKDALAESEQQLAKDAVDAKKKAQTNNNKNTNPNNLSPDGN